MFDLGEIVEASNKETLTRLVDALISKDRTQSEKAIDELLEDLYEINGLNSL